MRHAAWYIFPALHLLALGMYTFACSSPDISSAAFKILVANPLVLMFYLGTLLLTVPQTSFTIVALRVGVRRRRQGLQGAQHLITAGWVNALASSGWLFCVFINKWILAV
jgi:hypothetical protein